MNLIRPKDATELSLNKYKVKAKFIYMNQLNSGSNSLLEPEEASENDFANRYVNVPNITVFSK